MTSSNPSSTPPSSAPSASPPTNLLSDIFSDSPPASPSSTHYHPTDPSDIPRLRSTHVTNGYREGIAVARDQAVQPGFDEAYPLGAILGLRVGCILGLLEGLYAAFRVKKSNQSGANEKERKELDFMEEERKRLGALLERARAELKTETLFGKEYWKSDGDGLWAYQVHGKAVEQDVTFWEVAEQHPAVQKWMETVRNEVQKVGIQNAEDGFSGIGNQSGGARLED
ncbi:MAG: hypothetical protein Q9182_003919 [Xanthomendoza sp. 2 TL-2023]